jgi:hypothetical protein
MNSCATARGKQRTGLHFAGPKRLRRWSLIMSEVSKLELNLDTYAVLLAHTKYFPTSEHADVIKKMGKTMGYWQEVKTWGTKKLVESLVDDQQAVSKDFALTYSNILQQLREQQPAIVEVRPLEDWLVDLKKAPPSKQSLPPAAESESPEFTYDSANLIPTYRPPSSPPSAPALSNQTDELPSLPSFNPPPSFPLSMAADTPSWEPSSIAPAQTASETPYAPPAAPISSEQAIFSDSFAPSAPAPASVPVSSVPPASGSAPVADVWTIQEQVPSGNVQSSTDSSWSVPSKASIEESWVVPAAGGNSSMSSAAPPPPSSPPALAKPALTLRQYAWFRAEMATSDASQHATIRNSVHLTASSEGSEDASWNQVFKQDPNQFNEYLKLFGYFKGLRASNFSAA